MDQITIKKKPASYIIIGGLLLIIGGAWGVISIMNGGFDMVLLSLFVLLVAAYLIYKNAAFCVIVDDTGITRRQAFQKEEYRSWAQLELWLTFTPTGKLRDVILRHNEKNWCEMIDPKNLANFSDGLALIQKHLKVSKMFNHRGEMPVPPETPGP